MTTLPISAGARCAAEMLRVPAPFASDGQEEEIPHSAPPARQTPQRRGGVEEDGVI